MQSRPDIYLLITTALALSGFAPAAFAYLDPSTGSMILSAIVGLFATAGLVIKNYWYKLKSFFKGSGSSTQGSSESSVAKNVSEPKPEND